jgi:Zn-dependent protease
MFNITPEFIVLAFISYVVFLFSTTCHEAAHALAAKIQGDETAALGGQVTLNPMPHIRREPYGMVIFPILSLLLAGRLFGWASAPFDADWERRYPHRSAIMALAGPVANFTLMFLAVIGIQVGRHFDLFHNPEWGEFLGRVFFVMFSLNLLLGVFNLVPVRPLDGSSVIMLFMSESTARRYLDWLREGNFGLVGLIVVIVGFKYVYAPIEAFVGALLLQRYF